MNVLETIPTEKLLQLKDNMISERDRLEQDILIVEEELARREIKTTNKIKVKIGAKK